MVRLTVRLDPDVHAWLENLAQREERTLNVQINRLLRQLKEQAERPPPDTERP